MLPDVNATTRIGSRGRVLAVDDEPAVGEMLQSVFTELGYAVKCAGGGREALDVVLDFKPDVVLLDLLMPEMSGIEVLDRLRRERPELPVVILSGSHDAALARRSMENGAFDFLPKPCDLDLLAGVVAAAIGSSSSTSPPALE
jgi:CheY-like chemotaxis protein